MKKDFERVVFYAAKEVVHGQGMCDPVSTSQKLVLKYLAEKLDEESPYRESIDSISKELKINKKTVISSVKFWIGLGVLVAEKVPTGGRGNVQWLYKNVNEVGWC